MLIETQLFRSLRLKFPPFLNRFYSRFLQGENGHSNGGKSRIYYNSQTCIWFIEKASILGENAPHSIPVLCTFYLCASVCSSSRRERREKENALSSKIERHLEYFVCSLRPSLFFVKRHTQHKIILSPAFCCAETKSQLLLHIYITHKLPRYNTLFSFTFYVTLTYNSLQRLLFFSNTLLFTLFLRLSPRFSEREKKWLSFLYCTAMYMKNILSPFSSFWVC